MGSRTAGGVPRCAVPRAMGDGPALRCSLSVMSPSPFSGQPGHRVAAPVPAWIKR